ncbi:hypothetical protein WJX79_002806 [Trebouxia sp. C0005]
MARRIVPELISPSQAVAVQPAFESVAEQPLNLRFNLEEQAELAKTMLEPGRKIFVDISQDSKVNWRKLQKAAGVQKAKPQHKTAPALSMPTDKAQPFQVPVGRGGGSNIFASVVERLEAGLAMPHEPDSDDSASEHNERPANPNSESDGDSEGGNNEFAEYDDEFIDDSEFLEYYGGDWHKPKHSGFFINQGEIEKTDELLMSDEPGPEPRKRRTKPKQSKPGAVRQVMGKDGKMTQVRRRKVNPDGTPVVRKTKATSLISPAAALGGNPGHAQPAEAPQQHAALTPEEDKIPLAMMAGVTPAKPPRALTESLPASPVAGVGPQPPAQARTPQTGRKRSREGAEGIGGYVIPSDVRNLLDQLKDLAESLGLPKEEGAEEAATQPGEEKVQKKLPPQLNPLLAKLARAAARENEKAPGARTTIANAAYSFLHPWTQKGNMAVRLKKLHESAQARYEKSKDGLVTAVAQQQPVLTGAGQTAPGLVGSDDDFAALPASSQQPTVAAGTAGAGSSSLAWNKMQEFALHEYVTAVLELQGGREDNPRLWEDVAASPVLWGPNKVTPAELKEVYFKTKPVYSQPEGQGQPKKRPRKAGPLSGNVDTIRASGTLDEALGKKFLAQEPLKSQPPSASPSPSPPKLSVPPAQPSTAPGPPAEALQHPQAQAAGQLASSQLGASLPEQRPQLWPSGGSPLAATPQLPGLEAMPGEGQAAPSSGPHPAGALQAQAAPLVAQPSDSLSQQAHLSQGEAEATPTAPSKEEFLQFGVDHGGDRELLSRGLYACREGTIKEITYKVLLHAGPVGLKVSKVVEAAKAMGLVASDWVSNKNSRSSQISNAIRNTDMFTHVGDHRYAIAGFPGVQHVPLKPQQGKKSGDKPAAPEDTETKHELVPATAAALEAHISGLAAPSSAAVRETHNSNTLGMAAAPAMTPILPAQAPLPHDTAQLPPVLIAALNQINQGQAQQGLPAIDTSNTQPAILKCKRTLSRSLLSQRVWYNFRQSRD